jgi:hypothetical protein
MCVDNDDCRWQHWNTWQKAWYKIISIMSFEWSSQRCVQCVYNLHPKFQGCLNMPSNVDNIFKPTRMDNKHYNRQHKRTSMKFLFIIFTQLKISITKASLFWNSFTWACIPCLSSMLYNYIKNDFGKKKTKKENKLS